MEVLSARKGFEAVMEQGLIRLTLARVHFLRIEIQALIAPSILVQKLAL
jgi:hypothetical protein